MHDRLHLAHHAALDTTASEPHYLQASLCTTYISPALPLWSDIHVVGSYTSLDAAASPNLNRNVGRLCVLLDSLGVFAKSKAVRKCQSALVSPCVWCRG